MTSLHTNELILKRVDRKNDRGASSPFMRRKTHTRCTQRQQFKQTILLTVNGESRSQHHRLNTSLCLFPNRNPKRRRRIVSRATARRIVYAFSRFLISLGLVEKELRTSLGHVVSWFVHACSLHTNGCALRSLALKLACVSVVVASTTTTPRQPEWVHVSRARRRRAR